MPITSSAKKAIRNSEKKKVFNVRRNKAVDNSIKAVKKLIKEGKATEAKKLFSSVQKALDKAAKGNTISKNTASRKKSRVSQMIKKASLKK